MAVTQNLYTGDGSTVLYSFTFPYLEESHVKVALDGTPTTEYTFANATTISFNTAPASRVAIRIYRDTDDTAPFATFFPGSAIRSQDLNENFNQSLYLVQEVDNNTLNIDGSNPMLANLDMGGFRVINAGLPVATTDVATKEYVDDRTGDLTIPGHTYWRKVAVGGETDLTGTGDVGGVLNYSATREQVFLNGALLQRGADYTANDGTTVTVVVPLTAGDVVDIRCVNNLASGNTGQADDISYGQQFPGQVTRSVASKLADVVSVKDFGAVGDGVADDTAAIQAAITHCAGIDAPDLFVPPGTYIIDGLLLDSTANLRTFGPHCPDIVTSRQKVVWQWKSGSTANALLTLRSVNSLVFENIFFRADNAGKNQIVLYECNGDTTAAPLNKFANSDTGFIGCSFSATSANPMAVANIYCKSSASSYFDGCIITGPVAIKLGADTDPPAGGTGTVTIPDGRATRTVFTETVFRGDIIRERAVGVTYERCTFRENSVPYDGGSGYRSVKLYCSGAEEVRRERIIACGTDADSATNVGGLPFYTSASAASPTTPSLYVVNSFFNGNGVHFDILNGYAIFENNEHQYSGLGGTTYTYALRYAEGATIEWRNNNVKSLESVNTPSVILTKAVVGDPASLENETYVLRRRVGTDYYVSGNTAEKVLEVTPDQIKEGLYEFSYSVNLETPTSSSHIIAITVDGVNIPETARTINPAANQKVTVSVPPVAVWLDQTLADTRSIALTVRQVSGTPATRVYGATYRSWATVKYLGAG